MQIFNVTSYSVNKQNFGALGGARRITQALSPDIVDFSPKNGEFKSLTLKIINKLFKTDFKLSGKNYGEYMFPAMVLDKKTGEPVEVVVKLMDMDKLHEEYYILNPKEDMNIIAHRFFDYDVDTGLIKGGHMKSLSENHIGLGPLSEQITIERAFMQGHPNLEIEAIAEAYLFHKNCGFVPVKRNVVFSQEKFNEKIVELSHYLKLDEDKVRNMAVYRMHRDKVLFDYNSTYANMIEYMYKNENKYEQLIPYYVEMQLSDNAIKEWKMYIAKHPVLIDKKLPENYHAWENAQ